MKELDVQPKKRSSLLTWILAALALIALLFFVTRRGNKNENTAAASTDTTAMSNTNSNANTDSSANMNTADGWGSIDFNAPAANYEEITDKNIGVRGGSNYAIYSLGENILFDEGKSTISSKASKNLQQIAASIEKRYKGGEIRVYGHTDSIGSSQSNKQLAEERAKAVEDWLVKNANVSANRISIHPIGESQPLASNASKNGREQNRSVEIVARNAQ
jgi:outer membrane protein OmpA-like peptidoglycan-associated protein